MSDIPTADLRISAWPPRPTGGQQVGTVTGIQIEHLPSGVVAQVNLHQSQHRNKEIALDMILTAITHPRFR